jgi:uncharacterized membrane protein
MRTKNLTLAALFIALSYVGANVKILGTIAFDSMPGFLGALILGPVYGAAIGAIGHFLTALLSGFPLTLPVHLIIMVSMALTMVVFSIVYRRIIGKRSKSSLAVILSIIAAVLFNGPISLLMVSPLLIPTMGIGALSAMLPVLAGVSALNVILAFIAYKALKNYISRKG